MWFRDTSSIFYAPNLTTKPPVGSTVGSNSCHKPPKRDDGIDGIHDDAGGGASGGGGADGGAFGAKGLDPKKDGVGGLGWLYIIIGLDHHT